MRRGQLGARVAAGFNQDALTRKDDMHKQHTPPHLDDALELADLLRPSWPAMDHALRASGVPLNDGEGSGDGGGEGSGDGSTTGNEGGDGNGGDGGSGEGSAAGGDGGDGSSGSGAGDGAGGGNDDEVTLPKSEVERLRRKVAEQEKAERKRQREAAEAAGDHQKVVQQVETERDEAIRERDEARAELTAFQQSGTVTQVAGRLNFHDPSDAINLLPDGVADRGEAAIEAALRDLAKAKPYLVQEGSQRSGAPVSGNGGGSGGTTLTKEQVEAMSRDEIKERWGEVSAFYESQRT